MDAAEPAALGSHLVMPTLRTASPTMFAPGSTMPAVVPSKSLYNVLICRLTESIGTPTVARLSTMRLTTLRLVLLGAVGKRTHRMQFSHQPTVLHALRERE